MFINEMIWCYRTPPVQRLTTAHSTILFYSKGNWVYPSPIYHEQTQGKTREDDRGKYYNKSGLVAKTMAKNSLSDKSKLDSRDVIYKDGEIHGMKVRKVMSETRYYTWFKENERNLEYPTQKPYKLLERIICLSTQ